MKKRFLGIFLAAALFAGMTHTAAAANISITRWNATTTTFTATLSGELTGDVTVSLAGETITPEVKSTGGKTSITANVGTKLALDTWYTAEITADGSTVCMKEFQLKKLFEDDFNGYADNAAIGAVYKAIYGWSGVTVDNGKMKLTTTDNYWTTIYHTDFETTQKEWRDYTLDIDYIPNSGSTKDAYIYMEAHPAAVDQTNMSFGKLYTVSTASATIRGNDIQISCANNGAKTEGFLTEGGFNYKNLTDVTNGIATAQNLQISTKDKYAMVLADKKGGGKVVEEFKLPEGAPRGGGFAFSVRDSKGYCLDNLKVYKAVEKTGMLGYTQNITFADENDGTTVSGTLEVLNKTDAAKPVTVIAALYNADNRMTALRVLEDSGAVAADESRTQTFSVSAVGTDTNRLCLYLLDDLTSLTLYGEPITVLK